MKSIPKAENKEPHILLLSNISIGLDTYDDIFSDFDPRPYSERTLSDDFLVEVRKIGKEKKESINELWLLMPSENRNTYVENIIIKKLHSHFKENLSELQGKLQKIRKKGIVFILVGFAMMLLASVVSSLRTQHFMMEVLFVIFEPTGWFLVWMGLDDIFYTARKRKSDLDFYTKMAKSKVMFFPYPQEKKTSEVENA